MRSEPIPLATGWQSAQCTPTFLRMVSTGMGLGLCLIVAGTAASAKPVAFEQNLRRSIAVKGQEQTRFRLSERMGHYRVPGVSVAIIEGCRIVDARGFGSSAGGGARITPHTLFQAGSISKSLTAVAALRLVEQGHLKLDDDVRSLLKSWTFEESPILLGQPVTLRRLLNHTAGLNEIGGKGYARGTALPTLPQILDGAPPSNTPRVRVEKTPGSRWVYSSGGYYVVQALLTDVTSESFPQLADRLIFRPVGMAESSFAQPLDVDLSSHAASAVGADGSPLEGGWRVNPELAAGGLWTTPADLARFLIVLTRDIRGDGRRLLGQETAIQMMKPGLKNWGLGVELGSSDGPRRIGHTGHNAGYVSEFVMYPDSCQGAVVMTNADEGGWLATEVLRAIGDAYGWPERRQSPVQAAIPLTQAIADRFVGTYRLRDFPTERFFVSRTADGGLYWARVGHIGRDLLPENAGRLFSPDSKMTLDAIGEKAGKAVTLELSFGGGKNIAERVE